MSTGSMRKGTDWALALLRNLPRVALDNLKPPPKKLDNYKRGRGQHGGRKHNGPNKGSYQRMNYPKLGFENGQTPFYLKHSVEDSYYKGHHLRRQYPPLSLGQLQLLVDTRRINAENPIDLVAICNTKIYSFHPQEKHFGFHLTDEGIDKFTAKVNVEVQWTTEAVIAAVERNGGMITTAYYDMDSLFVARDPATFFKSGRPIPKRMIPPEDAIEYYTDPKFRGYLADPDLIAEERLVLAQKYGYSLSNVENDPAREMLTMRKDPRQIFFGLEPGWAVSLRDKCILKPKDPQLKQYYQN